MSALLTRALKVVDLGQAMRAAQGRYFRTRNNADLLTAKRLEREFDDAAAALILPAPCIDGEPG